MTIEYLVSIFEVPEGIIVDLYMTTPTPDPGIRKTFNIAVLVPWA